MIAYAVSLGSMGSLVTSKVADAFRRAKIRNVELDFGPYAADTAETRADAETTRVLIQEKVIRPLSVHLPFYGGGKCWDPSALDEDKRHEAVNNFIALVRAHADVLAPLATLHASNEPPMSEHPQRLDQACRTIEELIPVFREYGVRINVEYLPRTCIGDSAAELRTIVSRFDPDRVGICFDVNHIMDRYRELPDLIASLASRIHAFHICDYDGVDETHWFPGQGVIA